MRYRRMSLLAAAVVALLAAGCGSSSPSSSVAQSSQPHSIQPAINFTACMRSHRVPDFPYPTADPRAWKQALAPSTPHSPAFVSAVASCQHLMPGFGQQQSPAHNQAQDASFLAFARCIRGHGFPSFPDPTSAGELTHQMLASAGIDLHQPAVVQAADTCVSVTHGYITRTDVARFIAGQ